MSNLIQGVLNKPTNDKLSKFLGIVESTVRYRQKNQPEEFEAELRKYRMEKSPFISLEDYNLENNTNYKDEDVLNKVIPGILNSKDGSVMLPTNLEEILFALKNLKQFGGSNVISLSNFKGGVGKSSTAINVATVLAFFGLKVLIVDLDIQGNTTSMFDIYRYKKDNKVDLQINKIEELYDLVKSDFKYTIVDLMADIENDNIESMIKEGVINLNHIVKTVGRLDIIPNSCSIENALKFEDIDKHLKTYGNTNKVLDEVLSYVKEDYDFVIIDTPPSINLPLRMSILATDYFILALTADKMAKDGIAPFLVPIEMHKKAYRKEKGKDIVVLGGILNKYQDNSNVQRNNKEVIDQTLLVNSEKSELGEAKLFNQVIKQSNVLNEAQYETCSVLVYQPTNEIVRDYFNLCLEIVDSIIISKMSTK